MIAKTGRGGSRSLPYAFTEHGVLMLASVLHSNIAALASINISRAFAGNQNWLMNDVRFLHEFATATEV